MVPGAFELTENAVPSTGPGQSNLLSTVARANGLAVIPVGVETAQVGDRVRVMLFRALEGER